MKQRIVKKSSGLIVAALADKPRVTTQTAYTDGRIACRSPRDLDGLGGRLFEDVLQIFHLHQGHAALLKSNPTHEIIALMNQYVDQRGSEPDNSFFPWMIAQNAPQSLGLPDQRSMNPAFIAIGMDDVQPFAFFIQHPERYTLIHGEADFILGSRS